MKILFIDDEPIRLQSIPKSYRNDCHVAHGMDQIAYYLVHSEIKFDLICCDHDMPLLDGIMVCKLFLYERNTPVVIHSMNDSRRKEMAVILEEGIVPHKIIPITQSHWWMKVCAFYTDMTGKTIHAG